MYIEREGEGLRSRGEYVEEVVAGDHVEICIVYIHIYIYIYIYTFNNIYI